MSYFFSLLYIPTPTACSTECTHTSLSVLYNHDGMCVPPIRDPSNASSRVLQLTSWCASSTEESCISTSNRTALMDEWVSLQSGVVTESKLIAETSALPTVNGGTAVGKLNGGNCVGAPEGKKQLYNVYSPSSS